VITVFPTKAARLAFFRAKLATSAAWANKALVRIYAYQTAAEKIQQTTKVDNGVGFSGKDGEILSKFAVQVERFNAGITGGYAAPLSPKQQALVLRLMPRYAAQLLAHLDASGNSPFVVVKGTPWVAQEAA